MNTEASHTPTPWRFDRGRDAIVDAREVIVADAYTESDHMHIVLCVNAHDELVSALRRLTEAVDIAATVRGRMTGGEGRALEQAKAILGRITTPVAGRPLSSHDTNILVLALERIGDPRMWTLRSNEWVWRGETEDGNEIDTQSPIEIACEALSRVAKAKQGDK